ncbi:MAG TPA: MASE1 domain-containing protein [Thermoanaerobaculia bacterium]|nr:MASE1 domain-containing protein [Thermoanaerobaculia bacterium]
MDRIPRGGDLLSADRSEARSAAREIAAGALLFASYVAAGRGGLRLAVVHPAASSVWAPTGIAIAALIVFGLRLWPAVFAGALVVNATTGASLPVALGIAAGNAAEAAAGAWLVRRYAGGTRVFGRAIDVFRFAAFAMAVAAISAAVGVASLAAGGTTRGKSVLLIATIWWMGDVTGALVVAPALVLWLGRSPSGRRRRKAEVVLFAVAAVSLAILLFDGAASPLAARGLPLQFLCMPVLLWAAFRLGSRETATWVLFLSAVAVLATMRGQGPFGLLPPTEAFPVLQAFMGVTAVTVLVVAALVSEREKAATVRDEFLSIAGHELRNPVTALVVHLQNLSRIASAAKLDEVRNRIAPMRRSADRITALVDELLNADRIASGRWTVRPREVDLAAFVRSAVASFVDRQGLSREWAEVSAEDPVPCRTDPDRLEHVVQNLLSNALKYGLRRPIRVEVGRRHGTAVLSVRDFGIGIAPQDRRRIFERFERLGGTPDAGFGLGLWIARETVAALGGQIRVEEPDGEGSLFVVELPAGPAPAAVVPVAAGEEPGNRT